MERLARRREGTTDEERVARFPVPTAMPLVDRLTALQQSAGNRAVSAMLSRTGGDVTAATPEEDFRAYANAGNWARAARSIVDVAAPEAELVRLDVAQLRPLQDALVRLGDPHGADAANVLAAIGRVLQANGVDPAKVGPGTAYGEVVSVPSPAVDGDPATGAPYAYAISFRFLPDLGAVQADQIAFIQTARVVDTLSGDNRDQSPEAIDRQTLNHTSIDKRKGKTQGWYGMRDNGREHRNLHIWERADPTTPAYMLDRPSGTVPDATWDFETAVVCLSGPDAGTVYATILWGFTTDAALRVKPKPQLVTNKQSRTFDHAVEQWNDQATAPDRPKNARGQQPLPELR